MYGWSGRFAGMGATKPQGVGVALDYFTNTKAQGWETDPFAGMDQTIDPRISGDVNSSTHLSYWDQFVSAGVTPQSWDQSAPAGVIPCGTGTNPTPCPTQSLTQWLNENAGKVAIGVGGFFAIMLLTKAGR